MRGEDVARSGGGGARQRRSDVSAGRARAEPQRGGSSARVAPRRLRLARASTSRFSSSPPIVASAASSTCSLGVREELALLPADVPLEQVGERGELRALRRPGSPSRPPRASRVQLGVLASQAPHVRLGEVAAEQLLLGAGVRAGGSAPRSGARAPASPGRSFGAPADSAWPGEPLLQLERDEQRLVVLAREGLQLAGPLHGRMVSRAGGRAREPLPARERALRPREGSGPLRVVDAPRHGP